MAVLRKCGWVLLLASLIACSRTAPTEPVAVTEATPAASAGIAEPHIAWFEGSVTEAFALAKDSNTPLFLYWGAIWCPPCNLIKSTVFKQPDFIAETRHFLPVYLDGDTEDAQRWGEHFAAMGYPTLIVFSAQGEELTRLTSGMQPERYEQVLAQVRQGGVSVKALAAQAQQEPKTLSAKDWNLLAYYAWLADQDQLVPQAEKAALLATLAKNCPAELTDERARFRLLAAIESLSVVPTPEWSTAQRRDLANLLEQIFYAPALMQANLSELQYEGARLVTTATAARTYQRTSFTLSYESAMRKIVADETAAWPQRLDSLYAVVNLQRKLAPDAEMPAALQAEVRAFVALIRSQKLSGYQLQSLIPDAADLLHSVGLSDEARAVFSEELQRSVAPYYYMSYLSALEKDLGNTPAALEWSRKAWEQSQGPATRTQWGLSYLGRVLELAPDDTALVGQILSSQFAELAAHPGAFYQRSRVRLERSLIALQAWATTPTRRQALQSVRPQIQAGCVALPADAASAKVCQDYLQLAA